MGRSSCWGLGAGVWFICVFCVVCIVLFVSVPFIAPREAWTFKMSAIGGWDYWLRGFETLALVVINKKHQSWRS